MICVCINERDKFSILYVFLAEVGIRKILIVLGADSKTSITFNILLVALTERKHLVTYFHECWFIGVKNPCYNTKKQFDLNMGAFDFNWCPNFP